VSKSVSSRNTPGRPAGRSGDQVKADLLAAARENFLSKEFKAVSVRAIATAAGVNGAMVNYYFGSKQGLYLAMVEELLTALREDLDKLDKTGNFSAADFCASYSRLLARNPWWPNFVVREVLFSDGDIREKVLQRIASGFAPRLLANIQTEINSGHYRQDLDPRLTLMSLMGMTVFPFLAGPALKTIMNVELDPAFAEQLAQHNTQLFLHGALAPGDSAHDGAGHE
jgi:AcrR family transcriptional regulator